MSTRFNKPKNLRYQIILDEDSSDQLELMKEFSDFEKTKNNGVVITAIKKLFRQEITKKSKSKLNQEWKRLQTEKKRTAKKEDEEENKIIPIKSD